MAQLITLGSTFALAACMDLALPRAQLMKTGKIASGAPAQF